ncbi:MAG: molybdopterin-dependent oxidoreductase [Methylocystis sp.]
MPRKESRARNAAATKTTCPYCGVGCGVLATPDGEGGAGVAGDPNHPANFGRLCSKGSALGETLSLDGRLLHPMTRDENGRLRRSTWDDALGAVAGEFARIVARDGPDAVAVYLSGQLLTEDYYVANKLMKGFIGSSNVDTNSRLCMASTVAGQRRAFGQDTVPGCYEDLDKADLIVLVGSNAAWCHPILYQRMLRNKHERGAKLVVIDPRRTATAEEADLFLPVAPGMDQALFAGLLVHLARFGALDREFIRRHTGGLAKTLASARRLAPTIAATAAITGLRECDIVAFFDMFVATRRTVTCFSQGVNQSGQGTDKVNAIINCHLATGRIGKPGASPFSLTGQPNAMGGREVGGLANQLAAHMGFEPESVDRTRRFWNAPSMAEREGHKAVQMFEAVARGEIKALWVVGTNPAASLPDADMALAALKKLEFLVVSDNIRSNDTIAAGAHVLLPAQAWGEKDGAVTNSERRISRQRGFLRAPGEVRADWAIFAQVGRRMGFSGFDFATVADVFREHAALSAFENDGARDFDIGGLAQLSNEEYDTLEPTQWPIRAGDRKGRARLFADGGFFTPDRRARFVAPETPRLKSELTSLHPLRLNTGRIRDQWHTMTRTGASPRLARHSPEPFVEIGEADALEFGVADGGFARVSTPWGACVLRVVVTDRQPRGQIFAPIHWTDATSSHARVGALVAPFIDPISGQPEAKATPATIAPCAFASQGFLLARRRVKPLGESWWARAAISGGFGYKIASNATLASWRVFLAEAFGELDVATYVDEARGVSRIAGFRGDRLEFVLFIGPDPAPNWDAAAKLFESDEITGRGRGSVLSGRSFDGAADGGPIICACFGVGEWALERAIAGGCMTPAEIGAKSRAGTNCGSCLPEIKRLLARSTKGAAAR